ncbi:MAG: YraN family protein [Solirubrobacterales bacterium]
MDLSKQDIGKIGEAVSEEYLIKSGYIILDKNYRCKIGEIDIIAKNMNHICFIEVKTRKNKIYGRPCEAVNYIKQKKILKSAQMYILKNKLFECSFRFDVIEVLIFDNKYSINHIENAFQK